jgi:hypothetical protein
MKHLLLAAVLLLPGCTDMIIASRCHSRGFESGTPEYAQCYRAEWIRASAMADIANAGAAGAMQPQFRPAPTVSTYQAPPVPPGEVPTVDRCAVMSCAPPPAPATKFIPYTPGGGNPSGYGLLGN